MFHDVGVAWLFGGGVRGCGRGWRAPVVLQPSLMDCGPASLAGLLASVGAWVSVERLREVCATGTAGTSIDVLQDVASELGLEARQRVVIPATVAEPVSGLVPSLVTVRLPDGMPHFVVLWSRVGGWVQLMDPAVGRRWIRVAEFEQMLFRHRLEAPVDAWLGYVSSPEVSAALDAAAGVEPGTVAGLADRGAEVLVGWIEDRRRPGVEPVVELSAGGDVVRFSGAVTLSVAGTADVGVFEGLGDRVREQLVRPAQVVVPVVAMAAAVVATVLLAVGFDRSGGVPAGRLMWLAGVAGVGMFVAQRSAWGVGRRTELGWRRRIGERVWLLPDRFVRSRPLTDLVERAHGLHHVAAAPGLVTSAAGGVCGLVGCVVAVVVTVPSLWWLGVLLGVVSVGPAWVVRPWLNEVEHRVRTEAGVGSRLLYDAVSAPGLWGALGAVNRLRVWYRDAVTGWWRAERRRVGISLPSEALSLGGGRLVLAWLVAGTVSRVGVGSALAVGFWGLLATGFAQNVVVAAFGLPRALAVTTRVVSPFAVADNPAPSPAPSPELDGSGGGRVGAMVEFVAASVGPGNDPPLVGVDLRVGAGEKVAVVGRSGAGRGNRRCCALCWGGNRWRADR